VVACSKIDSLSHLQSHIIRAFTTSLFCLSYPQFMNQRELFRRRNQVRQMLGIMNRHRNVLKWSSNETEKHINMKYNICKYLRKMKKEFYTEAIFVGGKGRADVINADDAIIYEVYQTESKKSLEMKAKKYPLEVIFVNANQEFKEELLL